MSTRVTGKRARPKLTKEEQAENKQRAQWRREDRACAKAAAQYRKDQRFKCRRELAILRFMAKTGVKYHHHRQVESMLPEIKRQIEIVLERKEYQKYHPYIWNRQGEGKNYMPRCQFECIFSHANFDTIYDVPLDGTYRFQIYDSGERGLGSFNRITAVKVDEPAHVPHVNPGAIVPITAN